MPPTIVTTEHQTAMIVESLHIFWRAGPGTLAQAFLRRCSGLTTLPSAFDRKTYNGDDEAGTILNG